MMKKLENLELVAVSYDDSYKKATLTFLDEEHGEIREVNFNKQNYDTATGKFVDDPEKAEKVEKWCEEEFGLTFDTLTKAIGVRKDIYAYDNFNSLFETTQIAKFDEGLLGQILSVVVNEILDDGTAIKIRFDYEGDTYESKMSYAEYIESLKKWFVNPQKKAKQFAKFEEKFHMSVDDALEGGFVGKTVMVEVKKAMGKWIYAEVKPFPKPKK
jgi:hypothetical protein